MKNPYETATDHDLDQELSIKCIFCGKFVEYQNGDNDEILVEPCGCDASTKKRGGHSHEPEHSHAGA
jgi:hypothetical protein